MAKRNSSNQDYTNNADGWDLTGGTTGRKLTVTGANITLTGSGSNTYTFPATAGTLALQNSLTFYTPDPVNTMCTASTEQLATNTTALVGAFMLPGTITVNKLTFGVSAVGVAGTLDIAVYSADGATKHIDITTASISATGGVTTAVSSVVLNPGIYYIAVVPNGTADISVRTWITGSTTGGDWNSVSSEPVMMGTLTVTAGTLPATITPTSISTAGSLEMLAIRLDN